MNHELDIEQLRYLLAKLFGESISPEELVKITGKPEPVELKKEILEKSPSVPRFQALRAKLEQNKEEPNVDRSEQQG